MIIVTVLLGVAMALGIGEYLRTEGYDLQAGFCYGTAAFFSFYMLFLL